MPLATGLKKGRTGASGSGKLTQRSPAPTFSGSPSADRAVQRDPSQELLGQYFRDVAPIAVLQANQEGDSARRIEEATIQAWQHLLGQPQLAADIVAAAEIELPEPLGPPARALLRACRSGRTSKTCRRAIETLAHRLRDLDADHRALWAAIARVESLAPEDKSVPADYLSAARSYLDEVVEARNRFVSSNLRLVIKIAKRYRNGAMPLVDLIQEGNLGLIEAVKRFDYRRGFRFSTYASWWIRHAICRAIAERGQLVRVPLHLAETRRKIRRARSALDSRFGEPATLEQISKESGIEVEKVQSVEAEMVPLEVRLDHEVSDGLRFAELIANPEAIEPLDEVLQRDASEKALQLVDELDPVEAEILRRRFGIDGREPQTLREIARDYNLSRERIRQIELQGLGRIRKRLLRRPIRSASAASAPAHA